MDIASLSMSLANMRVMDSVDVAVLKNAMETTEVAGDGLLKMIDAAAMEQSVTPELGGSIDLHI